MEVIPSLFGNDVKCSLLCTVYIGVLYAFTSGMMHLPVIIDRGKICKVFV